MMEAKSTDRKVFTVTNQGHTIGQIRYENYVYIRAEVFLSEFEKYEIKPKGAFGTSLSVVENNNEIAQLTMTWNGKILISFSNRNEYIIKLNNFFSNQFFVENKQGEKLILIKSKFNWETFQYRYDIESNIDHQFVNSENKLLLMLGVYAVNYFISTLSGTTAGLM